MSRQGQECLPFWKRRGLRELSAAEWESLCDGCGRCCLVKLEDEDSGELHMTSVACRLLDCETCRCTDYPNRRARVADCIELTPDNVLELPWLPATCAYRVLAEGGDLAWWHPLVSGTYQSVVDAGVSVSGRVISETAVEEEDLVDLIDPLPDRLDQVG